MPDVVAMCPGCRQQFIVAVGAGRAGCPSVCGNAAALWWALGLKSGAPQHSSGDTRRPCGGSCDETWRPLNCDATAATSGRVDR